MAEISYTTTRITEEELLAKLTRPGTRGTGQGRAKSSHGYKAWKAFLESGAASETIVYTNADDAAKGRLSLTKEADALNAEREAGEYLWVSPRTDNSVEIVDLGKMNNAQARATILTQMLHQQEGVAKRMEGRWGKTHQSVKNAGTQAKALRAAIDEAESADS